jgi:hypothetical protein
MENTFPVSVFHAVIQDSAGMQVFGDQSARMISWLFGVMNIAIAIALADLVGVSSLARRILPSLILTSTAFLDQMGDGRVDLISSVYSLAAVYWMAVRYESRQSQFLYFCQVVYRFSCILRHIIFCSEYSFYLHLTTNRTGFLLLQAARHANGWLWGSRFAIYHFLSTR